MAKLVDARDLKSLGRKAVRVRPPVSAPFCFQDAGKSAVSIRPFGVGDVSVFWVPEQRAQVSFKKHIKKTGLFSPVLTQTQRYAKLSSPFSSPLSSPLSCSLAARLLEGREEVFDQTTAAGLDFCGDGHTRAQLHFAAIDQD